MSAGYAMDPVLKDLAQVAAWLVAAVGGVIAAFKAVSELERSNKERAEALGERREQFRWRQAEMARTILDQTWNDRLARSAMRMLDWSGLQYEQGQRLTDPISSADMWHALRTTDTSFTPDEQFVRDCFDQLFDYFERMEHYLGIGLINWEDIQGRLAYYADLLARKKLVYEQFLTTYQFRLAHRLLKRFPSWSTAVEGTAPDGVAA
jgi:hypothetical protein